MRPVPGALLTRSLELHQGRVNTHLIGPPKHLKFCAPTEIPSWPLFPTKHGGTVQRCSGEGTLPAAAIRRVQCPGRAIFSLERC